MGFRSLCVFVPACGKCCRGQKERKGGEGEEVYPYSSRDHLGGLQFARVGVRYKPVHELEDYEKVQIL